MLPQIATIDLIEPVGRLKTIVRPRHSLVNHFEVQALKCQQEWEKEYGHLSLAEYMRIAVGIGDRRGAAGRCGVAGTAVGGDNTEPANLYSESMELSSSMEECTLETRAQRTLALFSLTEKRRQWLQTRMVDENPWSHSPDPCSQNVDDKAKQIWRELGCDPPSQPVPVTPIKVATINVCKSPFFPKNILKTNAKTVSMVAKLRRAVRNTTLSLNH